MVEESHKVKNMLRTIKHERIILAKKRRNKVDVFVRSRVVFKNQECNT